MNPDVVDTALVKLFRSLPPAVADKLREKYEEDRRKFIEWLQSTIPSKDPQYWAKPSCTRCHGRGILGTLTTPSGEKVVPACSCTAKRYKKWTIEQRQVYNTLKEQEQGHEKTTD